MSELSSIVIVVLCVVVDILLLFNIKKSFVAYIYQKKRVLVRRKMFAEIAANITAGKREVFDVRR